MKQLFFYLLLLVSFMSFAAEHEIIPLWPDGKPNDNGINISEADSTEWYIVNNPVLHIFPADEPSNIVVMLIPGGGYRHIGMDYEGYRMVDWYKSQGVNTAILQYRIPNGHPDVPLSDVHKSMRILRSYFPGNLVGVHGFSAGGHLASTAATHYTDSLTRPDFQILFYPVIAVDGPNSHKGSRNHLLGETPAPEMIELYNNHCQVTSDTPVAFIVHSANDSVVPVGNSLDYYKSLCDKKVPSTLLVYPTGDHGWCYNLNFEYNPMWRSELSFWLTQLPLKINSNK